MRPTIFVWAKTRSAGSLFAINHREHLIVKLLPGYATKDPCSPVHAGFGHCQSALPCEKIVPDDVEILIDSPHRRKREKIREASKMKV